MTDGTIVYLGSCTKYAESSLLHKLSRFKKQHYPKELCSPTLLCTDYLLVCEGFGGQISCTFIHSQEHDRDVSMCSLAFLLSLGMRYFSSEASKIKWAPISNALLLYINS